MNAYMVSHTIALVATATGDDMSLTAAGLMDRSLPDGGGRNSRVRSIAAFLSPASNTRVPLLLTQFALRNMIPLPPGKLPDLNTGDVSSLLSAEWKSLDPVSSPTHRSRPAGTTDLADRPSPRCDLPTIADDQERVCPCFRRPQGPVRRSPPGLQVHRQSSTGHSIRKCACRLTLFSGCARLHFYSDVPTGLASEDLGEARCTSVADKRTTRLSLTDRHSRRLPRLGVARRTGTSQRAGCRLRKSGRIGASRRRTRSTIGSAACRRRTGTPPVNLAVAPQSRLSPRSHVES